MIPPKMFKQQFFFSFLIFFLCEMISNQKTTTWNPKNFTICNTKKKITFNCLTTLQILLSYTKYEHKKLMTTNYAENKVRNLLANLTKKQSCLPMVTNLSYHSIQWTKLAHIFKECVTLNLVHIEVQLGCRVKRKHVSYFPILILKQFYKNIFLSLIFLKSNFFFTFFFWLFFKLFPSFLFFKTTFIC